MAALGAAFLVTPACNSSSGGGGGGGKNNGNEAVDNNTGAANNDKPNEQAPTEPEVEDLAPETFRSVRLSDGSNIFHINSGSGGTWNSNYNGTVYYKKTGPDTAVLEFYSMKYNGPSGYAVIMYDFIGTVEFITKDKLRYDYTVKDRSYGSGVPHKPGDSTRSSYFTITRL